MGDCDVTTRTLVNNLLGVFIHIATQGRKVCLGDVIEE